MSFLTALTLVFITLKLMNVIAWSWWFVLMPAYLPLLIIVIMIVFFGAKVRSK